MRIWLSILVIAFGLLLLPGCSKPDAPVSSVYSFTNPFDVPITMDIYGSSEDYSHNKDRLGRYTIEPGQKLKVPFTPLETYWLDWYSADYSLNNWATVQ